MDRKFKPNDREFLFAVLGEIINRIERCGASPALTDAVTLTSDLKAAIGNKFNSGNVHAFERVQQEMKSKQHAK